MLRTLTAFMAFLFFVSASFAGKVAFIDMQYVLKNSLAGKEVQNTLDKKVEQLKKELEKKQSTEKDQQKLQQFMLEKQRELNQLRQKMADKFMKLLEGAVKEFSKKNGYDLILDKTPVIYGNKKLNKTKEFLNFFNNYYKKHK